MGGSRHAWASAWALAPHPPLPIPLLGPLNYCSPPRQAPSEEDSAEGGGGADGARPRARPFTSLTSLLAWAPPRDDASDPAAVSEAPPVTSSTDDGFDSQGHSRGA
jgi:hypothetical protein